MRFWLLISYGFASLCFSSEKWEKYYQNTLHLTEPHKAVTLAVAYFQQEGRVGGRAADLGAGTGRDTLYLLQKGWHVLATDAEERSLEIIRSRLSSSANLELKAMPFSKMDLEGGLDLVNASFSLPFCLPQDFPICWQSVVESLAIGGRFSGHFFGEKDSWAQNGDLTILSESQVLALFEGRFLIEYLQIEDGLIPCASGELKHWHVYHVVAKKVA